MDEVQHELLIELMREKRQERLTKELERRLKDEVIKQRRN